MFVDFAKIHTMGKKLFFLFVIGLVSAIIFSLAPVSFNSTQQIFIVPQEKEGESFAYLTKLSEKKLLRYEKAAAILAAIFFAGKTPQEGGYYLSESMNAWQILSKLMGKPDLVWININYCQRKEEIGEQLARKMEWGSDKLDEWNNYLYDQNREYQEGVYYPDTYLIPCTESVAQITARFVNNFNEHFAPLVPKFVEANIKWTTALKIASLIERESGGKDAEVVSAVIWNRLEKGMPLQIDATMQYTFGKHADGRWWGPINLAEKKRNSPYNTYFYKGLPPTPICSPRIKAISAVLKPAKTQCIYYLHDNQGQIHCSETYNEHLEKIEEFLN